MLNNATSKASSQFGSQTDIPLARMLRYIVINESSCSVSNILMFVSTVLSYTSTTTDLLANCQCDLLVKHQIILFETVRPEDKNVD